MVSLPVPPAIWRHRTSDTLPAPGAQHDYKKKFIAPYKKSDCPESFQKLSGQSLFSNHLRRPHQMKRLKKWLSSLSYKTGLAVAGICVICYAISFAQMLLPISIAAKGILWVIFFGLAKTAQYAAILILGKAGVEKLRKYFKRKRRS